jgi:Flp pilus assembly protein TadB
MRLIRRRRLDLLQDGVLGLLLAIFTLVETAGLGVVALLAALTGLMLVLSLVVERRRRRRSQADRW